MSVRTFLATLVLALLASKPGAAQEVDPQGLWRPGDLFELELTQTVTRDDHRQQGREIHQDSATATLNVKQAAHGLVAIVKTTRWWSLPPSEEGDVLNQLRALGQEVELGPHGEAASLKMQRLAPGPLADAVAGWTREEQRESVLELWGTLAMLHQAAVNRVERTTNRVRLPNLGRGAAANLALSHREKPCGESEDKKKGKAKTACLQGVVTRRFKGRRAERPVEWTTVEVLSLDQRQRPVLLVRKKVETKADKKTTIIDTFRIRFRPLGVDG